MEPFSWWLASPYLTIASWSKSALGEWESFIGPAMSVWTGMLR
jgi:hypothetical protein